MDFSDTPEEAEYRTAARAWLDENAEPKRPGSTFKAKQNIVVTVTSNRIT